MKLEESIEYFNKNILGKIFTVDYQYVDNKYDGYRYKFIKINKRGGVTLKGLDDNRIFEDIYTISDVMVYLDSDEWLVLDIKKVRREKLEQLKNV